MKRDRRATPAYKRALLRLLLAFVTCFVASGYFASLTHMAFVAHTACAEHGKLVHVQGGAALLADGAGDTERAATSDAVVSDEHDHCAGGTVQPGDTRTIGAAASITLPEDPPPRAEAAPPPRVEARVPLPSPIPILLLSPKSSPPA
jgi:hypothetical protein